MRISLILILGLLTFSGYSQELTKNSFGKGLVNHVAQDSSFSIKLGARFQGLYSANWSTGDGSTALNGSNFLIRRARLKLDGFAYSPKLRYKLQLGFSNRDISGANEFSSNADRILQDAVLKWNFYKNLDLWGGQTKLPGNREELISSGDLQFVDRSLLNSYYGLGREMGVQLHHNFNVSSDFVIRESLSFSQGEGRNVTSGNLGGMHYLGRIEILPLGEFIDEGEYSGGDLQMHPVPKLAIGMSYSFNHNAVRADSNSGDYLYIDNGFYETDISTLFLDLMLKYRGFSFMSEYAHRHAKDPIITNSDGSLVGMIQEGSGLNLQAGYLLPRDFELTGRFTSIDMKNAVDETQFTLGLSKYIVGHKLKVQTDLSYTVFDDLPQDDLMYRIQFEIHL